jgi:hypothetical protein
LAPFGLLTPLGAGVRTGLGRNDGSLAGFLRCVGLGDWTGQRTGDGTWTGFFCCVGRGERAGLGLGEGLGVLTELGLRVPVGSCAGDGTRVGSWVRAVNGEIEGDLVLGSRSGRGEMTGLGLGVANGGTVGANVGAPAPDGFLLPVPAPGCSDGGKILGALVEGNVGRGVVIRLGLGDGAFIGWPVMLGTATGRPLEEGVGAEMIGATGV